MEEERRERPGQPVLGITWIEAQEEMMKVLGRSFVELCKILSVAFKEKTFAFLLIQKGSKPEAELCAL